MIGCIFCLQVLDMGLKLGLVAYKCWGRRISGSFGSGPSYKAGSADQNTFNQAPVLIQLTI